MSAASHRSGEPGFGVSEVLNYLPGTPAEDFRQALRRRGEPILHAMESPGATSISGETWWSWVQSSAWALPAPAKAAVAWMKAVWMSAGASATRPKGG